MWHIGDQLASKGMIVITINYRLGALGFLHSGNDQSPGNQGLYDQMLALKWVNENVQYFGGNPKEITIVGQSAGSISVSDLISSPLTSGLFSAAILMTGSIFTVATFGSKNQLLDHSIELAIKLGCTDEGSRLTIPDLAHDIKVNPLVIKSQGETKGQRKKEMKGQLDRKGQYEVKGQGQNESHQIEMSDQIMNCLRKLSPSKFIQKMEGRNKSFMKSEKGNPFKGSFAFHPMGDSNVLPSHSPFELVNNSLADQRKKSLRLLLGTTDFEGGFFTLIPVMRALIAKYKNSSNQEWKNLMRRLIRAEMKTFSDEDVELIVSKYFDLNEMKFSKDSSKISKNICPLLSMGKNSRSNRNDSNEINSNETNSNESESAINFNRKGIKSLSDFHIYNFLQFHGDLLLSCPTFLEAELRSINPETSVHTYHFAHMGKKPWNHWLCPYGVTHGMEVPYFFGVPFSRKMRFVFNDEDRFISDQVMNLITKFIHNQDLDDWKNYESKNKSTLSIGRKNWNEKNSIGKKSNIFQAIKQVNTDKCQILNHYLKSLSFES